MEDEAHGNRQKEPSLGASNVVLLLQAINGAVEIIEATNANVDLTRLVGIKAFSVERVLKMDPGFLEVPPRIPCTQ